MFCSLTYFYFCFEVAKNLKSEKDESNAEIVVKNEKMQFILLVIESG